MEPHIYKNDRKFGYDVSVRKPTRTDAVGRSEKTLIEVSCVRLSTKFSEINFFLRLYFLLGHVLGHSSNNLVSPSPAPPPHTYTHTRRLVAILTGEFMHENLLNKRIKADRTVGNIYIFH